MYIDPDKWDLAPGMARLKKQFGGGAELIEFFNYPYLYLNPEAMRSKGLRPEIVERAVAAELRKLEGVEAAFTRSDLLHNRIPDTHVGRAVQRSFHPTRSGDIHVVFRPQCFINDFDGLRVAATHGSPWSYDTYVPIVFAGANIAARTVARRVRTVDVAATLAACLHIKPPSGSVGEPLVEVLQAR